MANLNNTNYICVSSLARVNFGYVLLFPVWLVICKTGPEVGKKLSGEYGLVLLGGGASDYLVFLLRKILFKERKVDSLPPWRD